MEVISNGAPCFSRRVLGSTVPQFILDAWVATVGAGVGKMRRNPRRIGDAKRSLKFNIRNPRKRKFQRDGEFEKTEYGRAERVRGRGSNVIE